MAVPLGKYQLLRKIASGGMGQVFLAREHSGGIERLVVIKRVLPHLAEDEEFLAMFQEEAQLVARLRHPNLITILEWAQVEGRYCLAMEYVQGEDVRRLDKFARARGTPVPVGLALRIVAEAAAGLHYAHQARDAEGRPLHLVHRDVSPQNILVGFDGGVKVIDFGVAKAAGSASTTATGVLKGKYPYMSPEQADGRHVDGRSDLFALGVVLWELLTGHRLFKGESDLMTLRLVRDCQVPPPSLLNPALPAGLDALVLRALGPTPDARFPDCGAFRLALEDFIVQNQLSASSAHLSAWLRELYAERIASEANLASLDQLNEDSDLDARSNTSRSGSDVRSQSQTIAPLTPTTHTGGSGKRAHVTRTVSPEAPRRRVRWGWAAMGMGVSLLAGGAAVILLRREEPAPAPPSSTITVDASPLAALPQPKSQPVTLTVRSEPAGARVEVEGAPYGQTPVELPLEPDAAPVTLALTLEGYEPTSRRVSAGDAPELSVKLRPRHAAQKPPRRGTPATHPPLDIKLGR
ncbi:serine/threonine protein kinase [Cystobacter ferrugineus]|uniref:Protein kinase n=1 Tax=Cystobacter ferrugineus TaxID=83449 RepID=A0A1L9AYM0_9BACT|nr:serine/threonine-protein kinase [Cystobacter ferrugineus]OJH35102.1 protein kinase [Cystobacter ferrugineus]